jgi:hypothetical protein
MMWKGRLSVAEMERDVSGEPGTSEMSLCFFSVRADVDACSARAGATVRITNVDRIRPTAIKAKTLLPRDAITREM